jgi:hypothetical protein
MKNLKSELEQAFAEEEDDSDEEVAFNEYRNTSDDEAYPGLTVAQLNAE